MDNTVTMFDLYTQEGTGSRGLCQGFTLVSDMAPNPSIQANPGSLVTEADMVSRVGTLSHKRSIKTT